jgi:hypothetical protein
MVLPLIGVLASLGSAGIGAWATNSAAQAQADAIRYAADRQNEQYNKSLDLLQPSIAAGNTAREFQLGALGLPGGNSDAINAFRSSPGYDFALKTGKNQVLTGAAATGNLFSGKTLKSLSDYGQGMADQQFGQWYDRLGGLSGAGSGAVGQAVNLGSANANNLASLALQGGEDRASSYIGGANAVTGGLQNLADLYSYYNPPDWLKNRPLPGSTPLGQGGIGSR